MTLATVIYLSLFYYAVTCAFLYSEGFHELRDAWWDFFSSKNNWLLKKIAFLSVCPLCLGTDIALIGNIFLMPELGFRDSIVLAFVNGGLAWFLASITRMFVNFSYAAELAIQDMEYDKRRRNEER